MAIETTLTIKQQNFCHEYISNGGNGMAAYLHSYNTKSETAAKVEASKLLKRDDITAYIQALTKPNQNKIINERERKRNIIWDRIQYCIDTNDDSAVARYMDILNKMDQEYINITRSEETKPDITKLDIDTLTKLACSGQN